MATAISALWLTALTPRPGDCVPHFGSRIRYISGSPKTDFNRHLARRRLQRMRIGTRCRGVKKRSTLTRTHLTKPLIGICRCGPRERGQSYNVGIAASADLKHKLTSSREGACPRRISPLIPAWGQASRPSDGVRCCVSPKGLRVASRPCRSSSSSQVRPSCGCSSRVPFPDARQGSCRRP